MYWRCWSFPHRNWVWSPFFNLLGIFIWFSSRSSLTVSLRISDDDFNMTWETFRFTFLDGHNLLLWCLPLFLAVLLRFITYKYHHQLIFPLCVYSHSRWRSIRILIWHRFPCYPIGFLCCRCCQQAGFGWPEDGWLDLWYGLFFAWTLVSIL